MSTIVRALSAAAGACACAWSLGCRDITGLTDLRFSQEDEDPPACVTKDDCPAPSACGAYECVAGECELRPDEGAVGEVVDPTTPDDCIQKVCSADGIVVFAGNPDETPEQDANTCTAEVCTKQGTVYQAAANEGADCADPAGACYASSMCVAGACAPQPKPDGAAAGDDGAAGNCTALACDGAGATKAVANPQDVAADSDPGDCMLPACSGSTPTTTPRPDGEACAGGTCLGGMCISGP